MCYEYYDIGIVYNNIVCLHIVFYFRNSEIIINILGIIRWLNIAERKKLVTKIKSAKDLDIVNFILEFCGVFLDLRPVVVTIP